MRLSTRNAKLRHRNFQELDYCVLGRFVRHSHYKNKSSSTKKFLGKKDEEWKKPTLKSKQKEKQQKMDKRR